MKNIPQDQKCNAFNPTASLLHTILSTWLASLTKAAFVEIKLAVPIKMEKNNEVINHI